MAIAMMLSFFAMLLGLLVLLFLGNAASASHLPRLLQQQFLDFPCRLTQASEDELWFCELDPRDADGVAGVILPVPDLELTDEQQQEILRDGYTTLFVEGYYVQDSVIVLPPDSDELVLRPSPPPPAPSPSPPSAPGPAPAPPPPPSGSRDPLFPTPPTPFGDKTAIMIRVKALDIEPTASTRELGDEVFGTEGDMFTMASQFAACSYNQFTVAPFSGTINGKHILDGVYETVLAANATGAVSYTLQSMVTMQLAEELGESWYLQKDIDFVMYCLPTRDFTAYAYYNSHQSVYSDSWCTTPSGQMHELGHNLNLAHANQFGITYADTSGTMGFSSLADDTPARCFNGPKSWQLEWYSDGHTQISIEDEEDEWTGDLVGIAEYDHFQSGQTVILRFEIPDSFGTYIYVAFNRAIGINRETDEGADQVLVTSQAGQWTSELLALLSEGDSYEMEDYGDSGGTLRIVVERINLEQRPAVATVKVTLEEAKECYRTKTYTDPRGCDCDCECCLDVYTRVFVPSKSKTKFRHRMPHHHSHRDLKMGSKGSKGKGRNKSSSKGGHRSKRSHTSYQYYKPTFVCDCDCDCRYAKSIRKIQ